jgi:hypothetical protein
MTPKMHDPGGKTMIRLPLWVRGAAIFGGANEMYRYELSRVWNETLPALMLVMMNPSIATPFVDDPSVAKGRRYAEDWGFGTLLVGNGFAYRTTDQKGLMKVDDPIGPDNDKHLLDMAARADMILFAYGKPHKSLLYRGPHVARLLAKEHLAKFHVLEQSLDGTPKHPLYLKGSLRPIPWAPAGQGAT